MKFSRLNALLLVAMLVGISLVIAGQRASKLGYMVGDTQFQTSTLSGITTGADGNLWVTEFAANRVTRVTPTGKVTRFSLPTPGAGPEDITRGADGNVWFSEYLARKIGRITPDGRVSEYQSEFQPVGLTAAQDGQLWVAAAGGGGLAKVSPDGRITDSGIQTNCSKIAAGTDGGVWCAGIDGVSKISKEGEISKVHTPGGEAGDEMLNGIATDANGGVWWTDGSDRSATAKIGVIDRTGQQREFTLPTPSAHPVGITPGADGNMWFAERDAGKVVMITPPGVTTEYSLAPDAGPGEVTAGPDGNVWVVEGSVGRVASISPHGAITEHAIDNQAAVTLGSLSWDLMFWGFLLTLIAGSVLCARALIDRARRGNHPKRAPGALAGSPAAGAGDAVSTTSWIAVVRACAGVAAIVVAVLIAAYFWLTNAAVQAGAGVL